MGRVDEVTLRAEIGDIAGLRVSVSEADADSTCGDGTLIVVAAVAVVADVGHGVARPLVEVVAVAVPCVEIDGRPA